MISVYPSLPNSRHNHDSVAEINREKLQAKDGWQYLLRYLDGTRGKEKVDLHGDAFTLRRDGEELAEYESRFRALVHQLKSRKIPSEIYGWFLDAATSFFWCFIASGGSGAPGASDSQIICKIASF